METRLLGLTRMTDKTKRLFATGRILLCVAFFVPASLAIYCYTAPPSYRAICRIKIEPFPAEILERAFQNSVLGPGSSVAVRRQTTTSLVEVEARAGSPKEAADQANNAAAQLQAALTNQPATTVEVIDAASWPLRPISPNVSLIITAGIGIGILLLMLASVFLYSALTTRRKGMP